MDLDGANLRPSNGYGYDPADGISLNWTLTGRKLFTEGEIPQGRM